MIFDPFGDFETAGYLQNVLSLKDPDEVKASEHLSFELSLEEALQFLSKEKQLNYSSVLKVHEILFTGFYHWAGKDRNKLVPHLSIFKGAREDKHFTVFEYPYLIQPAVEYALKLASNMVKFREKPGEVMGQLAFAHPFLDGNGRTILLFFMELSFRAGFSIDWSKTMKDDYLRALSVEIRDPGKGHLDRYLKPYIIEIHSRDEWPLIIGSIKGLDGLDKEQMNYSEIDDPQVRKHYKSYQSLHLDNES
ncbi:cell filamentation protein Fic [Pantoea rodasii]|uniref:protein adenylyltransferase n=1 Tax=Pantoea rodasii TaxID=1076549 RepID=A0A2M9W746_9GAMM|nr:Fic family protein [Pantoea rodasii]ORM65405.1 cell filamentation protein Fic [Pantoea rodasii]PJZ03360.1 cell filamentation protein Fic [Pantoea rodasii]